MAKVVSKNEIRGRRFDDLEVAGMATYQVMEALTSAIELAGRMWEVATFQRITRTEEERSG